MLNKIKNGTSLSCVPATSAPLGALTFNGGNIPFGCFEHLTGSAFRDHKMVGNDKKQIKIN